MSERDDGPKDVEATAERQGIAEQLKPATRPNGLNVPQRNQYFLELGNLLYTGIERLAVGMRYEDGARFLRRRDHADFNRALQSIAFFPTRRVQTAIMDAVYRNFTNAELRFSLLNRTTQVAFLSRFYADLQLSLRQNGQQIIERALRFLRDNYPRQGRMCFQQFVERTRGDIVSLIESSIGNTCNQDDSFIPHLPEIVLENGDTTRIATPVQGEDPQKRTTRRRLYEAKEAKRGEVRTMVALAIALPKLREEQGSLVPGDVVLLKSRAADGEHNEPSRWIVLEKKTRKNHPHGDEFELGRPPESDPAKIEEKFEVSEAVIRVNLVKRENSADSQGATFSPSPPSASELRRIDEGTGIEQSTEVSAEIPEEPTFSAPEAAELDQAAPATEETAEAELDQAAPATEETAEAEPEVSVPEIRKPEIRELVIEESFPRIREPLNFRRLLPAVALAVVLIAGSVVAVLSLKKNGNGESDQSSEKTTLLAKAPDVHKIPDPDVMSLPPTTAIPDIRQGQDMTGLEVFDAPKSADETGGVAEEQIEIIDEPAEVADETPDEERLAYISEVRRAVRDRLKVDFGKQPSPISCMKVMFQENGPLVSKADCVSIPGSKWKPPVIDPLDPTKIIFDRIDTPQKVECTEGRMDDLSSGAIMVTNLNCTIIE